MLRRNFLFVALLLAIGCCPAQASETFDEYINPRHLFVPFGRDPATLTSPFDILKRVSITCTDESFFNYGLKLHTESAFLSFPSSYAPPLEHSENFVKIMQNPIRNFLPENTPERPSGDTEYLRLDYLEPGNAFLPVTYVNSGPISLAPAGNTRMQCRWLRQYSSYPPSFPAVALYCEGENFEWNHRERSSQHHARIGKVHLLFPLALDPSPDLSRLYAPLNALELLPVSHASTWFAIPSGNLHAHTVFESYGDNPLRQKRISFRTERCFVELENTYQGE